MLRFLETVRSAIVKNIYPPWNSGDYTSRNNQQSPVSIIITTCYGVEFTIAISKHQMTIRINCGAPIEIPHYEGWFGGLPNKQSILVKLDPLRYLFVGGTWGIWMFETVEEIVDYYSVDGPGNIVHPIAASKNYVYFLLNGDKSEYLERTKLPPITADNFMHLYSKLWTTHPLSYRIGRFTQLITPHGRQVVVANDFFC